jgi:glycosyltransferase involved in cell wall biosynthesis
MKLLVYSHYFAPSIGGVETVVLSLACGLTELRDADGRRSFDVTLATQTAAGDFDDSSLPFPVVRRPGMAELWRLVRRADVVHVAGPSLAPLFLAWLAGRPMAVEHHGYQAICPNGLLVHQPDRAVCPGHFQAGHYAECLRCGAAEISKADSSPSEGAACAPTDAVPNASRERSADGRGAGAWLVSLGRLMLMFPRHWLARHAAHNIAITQHVLERHRLPRTAVVYYGVENLPGGQTAEPSRAAACGRICFAYVGRLVAEKGLPLLVQAAGILQRENHRFEVLLIGDGPERGKLESLIEVSGLRGVVRCTGFLSGAGLAEALCRVDVVVMPSAWEETAGLAAIEQMMRGRLVIASRIGGLGELVGDAGLTCRPGDADDLAQCMRELLAEPEKISTMGRKASERAQRLFLRKRMVNDHARIYREAAGKAIH